MNKVEAAIDNLMDEAAAALSEAMATDSAGAVFDRMLKQAQADGFETDRAEDHGGHIEFGGMIADSAGEIIGTSDEVFGLLCPLEALPAGLDSGEGRIAAVACYYAMKALAGSGFMPEKKVRLIICLGVEQGDSGLSQYLKRFKAPDAGFSVGGDFPASCGRMGCLLFGLAKKLGKPEPKGLLLRSFSGGTAADAVPGHARAVVRGERYDGIKAKAAAYREETGRLVHVKGIGKSLEIKAQGVPAHGADPKRGLNAISVLMDFMSRLTFASEGVREFLAFYNSRIGFERDGASLGCGFSDEVSGGLRLNPGMISGDDKAVKLTCAAYLPVSAAKDEVYGAMLPALDENDMGLIKISCVPPSYGHEGEASKLADGLAAIYGACTGDVEGRPVISPSAFLAPEAGIDVAFGPRFPDAGAAAEGDGGSTEDDRFFLLVRMYAEAIFQLTAGG